MSLTAVLRFPRARGSLRRKQGDEDEDEFGPRTGGCLHEEQMEGASRDPILGQGPVRRLGAGALNSGPEEVPRTLTIPQPPAQRLLAFKGMFLMFS